MQHRRVLAVIGVSVVLLLAIAFASIQTRFAKRLVFDQLRRILMAQGVVLEAGNFDFSLMGLRVSADRVSIRSALRSDLPPVFSAEHVSADLGLFDLIIGRYRINDSTIANPTIQVIIDEQGRDNLPPASASTGGQTDWFIFKMRSSAGSFAYEDRSRNMAIRLPLWDFAVDGNRTTGSQEFQFGTRRASEFQSNGKVLSVESIAARVALKQRNQDVEIHDARFVSSAGDVVIFGAVENLGNPQLDLAITSNIHLQRAAPYFSIEQKLDGDLSLTASVKGHPNDLKVSGDLKGEDLTAEMLTDIAVGTGFAYELSRDRVQFSGLQVRSPGLSLSGEADLALAASAGMSTAQAHLETIDLERLSRLLKLPITFGSRAAGSIDVRWPALDFTRLEGRSRIQLASRLPARNDRRIPVSGTIGIVARGGEAVASIDALDAGDLHVRGQVSLNSSKEVRGTLRADASDSGQALKLIAAWSGGSFPAGLELGGPAGVDVNLDGTVEQPRVAAILHANGLELNQLKNVNLEAVAAYTPQQVDVERIVVNWEQESLTASGRIGLTGRAPALDVHAELPNVSIHRILSALGREDVPAEGNLSITAAATGTIQNPVASFNVSGSDLRAYNEAFGNISAQAHLESQVLQLDSFLLENAAGEQLHVSGHYNIASGTYGIKGDGSGLTLQRVVLPGGTAIGARISLKADMSGTLENPNGSLQLSAHDLQIDDNAVQGAIDLSADISDHEARIVASAPSYGVTANVSVGTVHPYPAEVSVRAVDTDIAGFPLENLKAAISGHVSAAINASGDLSDIENARARAQISNFALNWRNRSLTSDRPIDVQYGRRELTISQASIRLDDSTMRVSGTLPLDAGSTGELTIDGKTNLATLADLIPSESVEAQGELVLTGNIRGNFNRIDPDIAVSIRGGSIHTPSLPAPLANLNLTGNIKEGRIVVEQLSGEWASAKINLHGEAPLALLPDLPIEIPRPAGPARASAEIQTLRLSALTNPPQNADGTISLTVEAEASKPEIDLVQARVTFPDLKLNVAGYSLEQVGTSAIEVHNGVASIQQFHLTGPQTDIRLAGGADLRDPGPIDVKLEGTTDAAVLALFSNAVRATGETTFNIAASGTVRQPGLTGFLEIQNGQAQIADPRIAAENLELRLDVNDRQIKLTRLEGSLNGGSIKGQGYFDLSDGQSNSSELALTGNGIFLEFPQGVRTVSNVQLNVRGDLSRLALSGNVDVIEGTYTDPLTIDRGILRYLQSQQSTITISDQSNALSSTQLDVGLRTLSPLVVNNNIAHAEITANLRVSGSIDQPGVTGRIDVQEGAELSLRERKYAVDRGVITFTNDRAIEPILDIAATTSASGYSITMQISGNATRKIETVLTSDPPLGEADIISVLATGRTLENAGTAGAAIAKEQALSYIAGELGTSITEEAGRAIGLNQVRIEPNLIANEKEPTARLTIGKDITPKLNFIYSMNLRNSSDQIWIADYDITRRFSTRGIRQDDNSYRFQFQHDLLFGLGGMPLRSGASNIHSKIGSVRFLGETHLTGPQLSRAAGLKSGKTYDFFSVQNARNRLTKTFADDHRLEARISSDKTLEDSRVDLTFRIKEGPKVEFVFDGWNVPDKLKDQIRNVWSEGVIDAQRIADVADLIDAQLVRDRFFGSQIHSSIEMPEPDAKRVVFTIQPGTRYNGVRLEFPGVQAITEDQLRAVLKENGFFEDDPEKREQAVPLIENLYKERGYVDVAVESPHNELDEQSKTVRIVFNVTEGPLYRYGAIGFEGNAAFTDADLASRVSIEPEDPFDFKTVQQTKQKLQDLYRKAGYDQAVIQYSQLKDVSRKIIDVTFNIQENYQQIFKEVEVEGNQKTSDNLVRTQIGLDPGDIVSYDKLSQARSNLYNTGAFSFVEIETMPAEGTEVKPHQTPVRLVARVREVQPWQLRYGGFYDTDRGPGGIVDFSNHNMLGGARVVGLQTRYDSALHEVRTYVSQPTLRRLPLNSVITVFQRREIHSGDDPDSATDDFITDRLGFSPTFEYRLHQNNLFTFGYRFEKTHTFEKIPDPVFPFDIGLRVAPLTSSFTRDTRDDPLDASRGRFTSHAFEWGLARLGSDLRYIKYYGQYFAYLPLGKPTVVPWVHTTRNRLVVALGARVGLARGLGGQEVISSERFLAGGGTTVRGYQQDLLGPLDPLGAPTGGDAVTVLNSELRFPLYKFFDGVAFIDAGNVYRHLADFKPFDLRASYGLGLRIRTPYVVLRLDYGLKFSPLPAEPRGKFFVSIGQAF